jgi:hypothetical protein
MRRCLKGLGGFPTSYDGFILGPVTRRSGSTCFFATEFARLDRPFGFARDGLSGSHTRNDFLLDLNK